MDNCRSSSGGALFIMVSNNNKEFKLDIRHIEFKFNEADIGSSIRILGLKDKNNIKISEINYVNNTGHLSDSQIFYGYYGGE